MTVGFGSVFRGLQSKFRGVMGMKAYLKWFRREREEGGRVVW